MLYETTETVDVYLCDVVESLKGTINSTEENQIIVPFFKNTVKEEKNYIVYLNADTVDSYIYFLSSTNSLLSINEKANVTRILEELK